MSSTRFAARYAKSLLEIAKEKNTVSATKADIDLVSNAIATSKELRSALKSPIIPNDKKQSVLNKLFGGKISNDTSLFLNLLAGKGRSGYLTEVLAAFNTQYNELNQITKVNLITATEMNNATRDNILNGLKSKEGISNIELTQSIDPSLIGGFILVYGDKQIDTSIRSSMSKLHVLVEDDSYVKKYY